MSLTLLIRFLLIKLHMDALGRKAAFSKAALRIAINQLPKQLDQTYEQALYRIKLQAEDDAELAGQVISWLYLSHSALTVRTLQQAIAKQQNFDPADDDSLIDAEKLASVCAGLVAINEDSQVIGFVHFTVAEYLKTCFDKLYPGTRRLVDYCCFHHVMWTGHLLSMIDGEYYWYREDEVFRNRIREERRQKHLKLPFWNYALFHMQRLQDRIRAGNFESNLEPSKLVSLSPDIVEAHVLERNFALLLCHHVKFEDYRQGLGLDLIFAVYVQDEDQCKDILENSCLAYLPSTLSACLAYSVSDGIDTIIELFLRKNVDPGEWHGIDMPKAITGPGGLIVQEEGLSYTSLGFAVSAHSKSRIKQILDKRPDLVNLPAIRYQNSGFGRLDLDTPLQMVTNTAKDNRRSDEERAECLEIVEILREYGADGD